MTPVRTDPIKFWFTKISATVFYKPLIKLLEAGELSTTELYKYGRYVQCMEQINKEVTSLGGHEIKFIKTELELAYQEAFEDTTTGVGRTINWGLQHKDVMEQIVNANFKGANFSERIWINKSKLTSLLDKEIVSCVASGQNKDMAVKKVMSRVGASFSDADRLVRTELMRVINAGEKKSYINNGYEKMKILIGKDERTCHICMGLEGQDGLSTVN